jgi:hypothetical protein
LGILKNGEPFKVWILIGAIDEIRFSDTPVARTYYRDELVGKPDVTPTPAITLWQSYSTRQSYIFWI